MIDLDSLLGEGEPEKKQIVVNNDLDNIHITKYAFEKAYVYARLACEKARGTIECGGYLIAPRQAQDRIATDSFLAKNQDVSSGLFTIEAEDVIKAGREINEMGYKVLGWWHSHGNLGTFFSKTDDNGQRTVLNEISAFNYVTKRDDKEIGNLEVRTEDERIVMFDKRNPERRYEIEVDGDLSKISITKLKLQQEKRIGFAYGLVVNVPGHWDFDWRGKNKHRTTKTILLDEKDITKNNYPRKPYAEIATRDLCGFCKNSEDKSIPVDITLFDTGKVDIDENVLMAEIEDRVKMSPRFLSLYGGKKYRSSSPLFTQQTIFRGGYDYGYTIREEDDFYRAKFETPAPKPNYQKPITPTPNYSIGDEVKVVRGPYKDFTGKISENVSGRVSVRVIGRDGRARYIFPSEWKLIKKQSKKGLSDKKDDTTQKKFDDLLNDEDEEGGNSGEENV